MLNFALLKNIHAEICVILELKGELKERLTIKEPRLKMVMQRANGEALGKCVRSPGRVRREARSPGCSREKQK